MIYHITTPEFWQTALNKGFYESASLQTEGFIHCCKKDQVEAVIKRYFADQKHLIIIDIDESKITSAIKHELSSVVNEVFPHIYGIINLDAVEDIHSLTS